MMSVSMAASMTGRAGGFRRGARRGALLLALGAAAAVGWARFVEPVRLETTRHEVRLAVGATLRLAHLTDLHTTGLGVVERRLLAALDEEPPDVVVITGDTLHESGDYERCRPLLRALGELRAPLGVFMVPGNWETAVAHPDLRGFLREQGVTLLRNESVELSPGLWLVGLDDAAFGAPDLDRACARVPAGAARIVLVHEPGEFDELAGRCEIVLAGHTHGGQVRLPFLPPLHLPMRCGDYVAGWYEKADSRMYVSRGIGMSGIPLRFCCRPELAILEVRPAR
jgi:predicted MPP superfamily phosphohydrolase